MRNEFRCPYATRLLGGQWWAMRYGSDGTLGNRGNVESVTYRKEKDFPASNPTLTATENKGVIGPSYVDCMVRPELDRRPRRS